MSNQPTGRLRRNLSRLALLGGAVALATLLSRDLPRAQHLHLVLDPEQTHENRVVQIDIAVPGEHPTTGAELLVPQGQSKVSHTTELRDGKYVLNTRVGRSSGTRAPLSPARTHRVDLVGQPTTIYLYGRK